MTRMRLGVGVLGAFAASLALATAASAEEYNLHSLPEFGRCVKTGKRGAAGREYVGAKCVRSEPKGGRAFFDWRSGAGSKPNFKIVIASSTKLKTAGDQITCTSGSGEGTYTTSKNLKVTKFVLLGCEISPASSAEAALCQNSMANNGEITWKELSGELGFVSRAKPKRPIMGIALSPASESNLAVFECGGANSITGKSLGTGTTRELQGSAIGITEPVNVMAAERTLALSASGNTQVPQNFEGGPKDTLTTLVGPSKTAAATTLTSRFKDKDEEALEVLARCAGAGC